MRDILTSPVAWGFRRLDIPHGHASNINRGTAASTTTSDHIPSREVCAERCVFKHTGGGCCARRIPKHATASVQRTIPLNCYPARERIPKRRYENAHTPTHTTREHTLGAKCCYDACDWKLDVPVHREAAAQLRGDGCCIRASLSRRHKQPPSKSCDAMSHSTTDHTDCGRLAQREDSNGTTTQRGCVASHVTARQPRPRTINNEQCSAKPGGCIVRIERHWHRHMPKSPSQHAILQGSARTTHPPPTPLLPGLLEPHHHHHLRVPCCWISDHSPPPTYTSHGSQWRRLRTMK